MFPTLIPISSSNKRIAATVLAFLFAVWSNRGLSQETAAPTKKNLPEVSTPVKTKSRYPAVVRERSVNFSIPNASTQPAASTESATAEPFLPKEIYQRNAQPILAATELIADGFDRSVVEILDQDRRVALGTVVGLNGHVVTKHSLIRDLRENEIRFEANGSAWEATIVGFDEVNDLALLKAKQTESKIQDTLRPITFTSNGRLKNGKIVVGIGAKSSALSVGITTAPPTPRPRQDDCENCIDMGLTLDANMSLTRVYPRTVGERLGMLVGDQILMVNSQRVTSIADYDRIVKAIEIGDIVAITYRRNGRAFVITDKVPSTDRNSKQDRWGGGPFSQRRSGFDEVLVHDSVIRPQDCGGPLVNLQGQFCGINIARSMRVCSLAIPADAVKEFVLQYVDEAELIINQ